MTAPTATANAGVAGVIAHTQAADSLVLTAHDNATPALQPLLMTAHTEHDAVYKAALSIDKALLAIADRFDDLSTRADAQTKSLLDLQARWYVRYGRGVEKLAIIAAIAAVLYALWRTYRFFKP